MPPFGLYNPLDRFTYVTVDWKGDSVTAHVNGALHMKAKETIKVDINPEGLLFFDRTS